MCRDLVGSSTECCSVMLSHQVPNPLLHATATDQHSSDTPDEPTPTNIAARHGGVMRS